MKKIALLLIALLLFPAVSAYSVYDVCDLESDPSACKELVEEQISTDNDIVYFIANTEYEFFKPESTYFCTSTGDASVKEDVSDACSAYSSSETYVIRECSKGGKTYATKAVCLYDSNTETYRVNDDTCDSSLGEPSTSSDCSKMGGSFKGVSSYMSIITPSSSLPITGKFTATEVGYYLIENLPVKCAGSTCSFSNLETAFTGTKSACTSDKYEEFFAGDLEYLEKGETASISLYPKVPSEEGDYEYQIAAYTGCGGDVITTSDSIKFTVSSSGSTSTTTSPSTVTVTQSGTFSNVNIPDSGIAGEKLIATATFTANKAGTYLLELEPDASIIGIAGLEIAAITAENSACDGNVHWASKSVTLSAGESVSLAFSPTVPSRAGEYQYRFNVWTGCSSEGGISLQTPSTWESVTVYSAEIEEAVAEGYSPACTEVDDCAGGQFCLNGQCLSSTVEDSICDTGSVCGTENEEVEAVEISMFTIFVVALVLVIALISLIIIGIKNK